MNNFNIFQWTFHANLNRDVTQREIKKDKKRRADELRGKRVTEGLTCLVIRLSSQARVSGSQSSGGQQWLGIFTCWGSPYLWLAVQVQFCRTYKAGGS